MNIQLKLKMEIKNGNALTKTVTLGVQGRMFLNLGSSSCDVMTHVTSVSLMPWISASSPSVAQRVTSGMLCFMQPNADMSHSARVSANSTTFSLGRRPSSRRPRPKLSDSVSICVNVRHWQSPNTSFVPFKKEKCQSKFTRNAAGLGRTKAQLS